MDQEKLSPELEKLISRVKLKEPPRQMMSRYLSEVNAKIDQGIKSSHWGFPQFGAVFAIGLALAGSLYFFLARPQMQPAHEVKAISVQPSTESQKTEIASSKLPAAQKPLTLEEEMAVLEAFSDESLDESAELFGDEEALEDLTVLDEVELSRGMPAQTSGL